MEKRNLKERVIKNSFWSFVTSLINRIGVLIFTVILARFLLPAGYGLYSIILSIAMIFYTFTDLGINQTLVRYISFSLSKDKKKISPYYNYLLKIKFFLAVSASLLLFILAYPLSFYIFKNEALFLPLLVASFYIFVLSFEGFYSQIFYSIERVSYLSLKESLSQALRIVFALFIFCFVASTYQITGIFVSSIFCSLLLILFSLFYLKKLMPQLYEKPKKEINKKRVVRFVGFLTIASISSAFFSYMASILLGIFLSLEYVGYYRVAFSIVFSAVGVIGFIIPILLPVFTKLKLSKAERVFNGVFRYLAIIIIPFIFGLLIFGKYILVLFGYSFLPAYLPLLFLAPLVFLEIGVNLFLQLFSAREKPQIFAKLILITCLMNIILNFIFIKLFLLISPLWATAGAGIATSISWLFYFFAAFYISRKKLGLVISLKPVIKPTIASLIMVGILLFLLSFIKDMTFVLGIIMTLFGVLVYFISMALIRGIRREDLILFKLLANRS